MLNQKRASPEGDSETTYLELLAYFGMTRHSGGWRATRELVELCRIEEGMHVLDVGCGIGKTACYLNKRHGCKVVGVDISPRMVEWAEETARREGVGGRVEFRVADAQELPFEDGVFDTVVNESVLSFVPDRRKALHEYMRVATQGAYIGLNETTWLKTPIPTELADRFDGARAFLGGNLETADALKELLVGSGLKDVVVRTYSLSNRAELMDRVRWFGFRGLLRNACRMLSFSLSSPANRQTMRELLKMSRDVPENFYEYYGYGIYVGRR